MSTSDAEKRVLDGTTWDEFCDALKEAGSIIRSPAAPQDAFNQAEGYRYLARLLRGGLESFLEFRDPLFPQLRCGAHETIKLGADNPDNRYESAPLSPKHDYRITGNRGTVDYLGFSTIINKYASGGTMEVTGHIDTREMEIGPNGELELIISQNEHPGNWLPMGPETNSINVRQTFQDRVNEKAADLKIERIGADEDRPEAFSATKLERGLQGAVGFVKGSATLFENWSTRISFISTAPGNSPMTKSLSLMRPRFPSARPGTSSWITGGWNRWTIGITRSMSTNTQHTTTATAVSGWWYRTLTPASPTGSKRPVTLWVRCAGAGLARSTTPSSRHGSQSWRT
mgnify:CR=1 FL=1